MTGIVLVAAGLIILDPAARTQTNIGTPPLDRLPASRTGAVRSDDRTVAKDAPLELMITASAAGNCRDVKGNFTEVFSPQNSVATGNIYNAGWLNAATEARFDTAVFPTPDPNKFSYGGPVTIATARGVLKGRRVYLTDAVSGFGTDMTDIDPKAGTGLFAGATGILYVHVNKSVTPETGPYFQEITAHVCFPPGRQAPDR